MTDRISGASTTSRLRVAPQQARSHARIGAVLDAAERLLAEAGVSAVTTTRVAAEVGMSVGAMYRYFPDKEAILGALAERFLLQFDNTLGELVQQAGEQRWADPADVLVDLFVHQFRGRPALLAILVDARLSEELIQADRAYIQAIADNVRQIVLAQGIAVEAAGLTAACHAAVLAVDAIVLAAFRLDPAGDPQLITEVKALLRNYLADISTRFGSTE
ncbi:TetR/AcrR family transcriptional regulator [Nocardia altamirensis]|uniref:TetR/AcrR family transcriptional regulator n=1 Tax=Nocardia altamirensis TaxID=472158 RepID=UPI0008401352|nr:TetR/AcrR family transcriptional regulator [Nocardia altamirensis]